MLLRRIRGGDLRKRISKVVTADDDARGPSSVAIARELQIDPGLIALGCLDDREADRLGAKGGPIDLPLQEAHVDASKHGRAPSHFFPPEWALRYFCPASAAAQVHGLPVESAFSPAASMRAKVAGHVGSVIPSAAHACAQTPPSLPSTEGGWVRGP